MPYGKDQRLAIVRDITREIKLERMRRDFVANASHELRSPLTVISGYLDALAEDEAMPSTWREPIGEMQRQAERMTRILRDLIELSRLESSERTEQRRGRRRRRGCSSSSRASFNRPAASGRR